MSTRKKEFLSEKQIITYLNDNGIDNSICYCKDCGKFIAYDNAVFHINSVTGKIVCDDNKLSFLSTRDYNGTTYRLCRCYDCVCKKFPEFKNVKFKFAHKAAKYTQYGFDVSDEDFNVVSKSRQSVTKEKMIKKYGQIEGTFKWKQYCDKQAETNTFEYKHAKYGITKEQFDDYNCSRAVTLNNIIKKHGLIEGLNKWNNYIMRQRYTCSKDYFIEQYGESTGLKKYFDFCDIRSKNILNKPDNFSKISYEMTSTLFEHFKNNEIYFGNNEYCVKQDEHRYYVDYYDKTVNIVIEFYGDFYHFNPIKYKADETYPILSTNMKVQDRWDFDNKRITLIQNILNCNVIIVWESTYRTNKKNTIQLLIDMINNKEKLNDITEI